MLSPMQRLVHGLQGRYCENTKKLSFMTENKIELKSVSELLGMKFFIPSYQRGYRWTKQQVEDLLNDVNEFKPEKAKDSDEETWYCLQPLVVSKMNTDRKKECQLEENKEWYEVVDGQQRLTTIFIILNLLESKNELLLKYQTRPGSNEFLQDIKNREERDDTNIDFHFMLEAKRTINHWCEERNQNDFEKRSFVDKLKKNCRIIWYETTDNAYDVFKRLNSGKISLSNAELVKALLLKDDNFVGLDSEALKLKQLEMAGDWDRMEQILHDDSFWYFINPEPEDSRFYCTRIDFLLEQILRCIKENSESEDYSYDVDAELQKNNYFIFQTFSGLINKESYAEPWKLIQRYFRTIKSWYDDREKYHYIGYLMNLKGEDKKCTLKSLLCESDKPKDVFLDLIKEKCRTTIGITVDSKSVCCNNWEYGKNNNEIHNVLLLFNLASTQNQISEVSRYPFDKHFQAAKKKWSLEHIHAQNEKRKENWSEEELKKLKGYVCLCWSPKGDDKTNLAEEFSQTLTLDSIKDENIYRIVIGVLMGIPIKKEGENFSLTEDFEKDDHLTNMALLQGDKNAAFNNKTYPEKREKLAEYENVEKTSMFVPMCTRNVFFKHYSPNSTNPLFWDEQAGLEYVTAMMKVVAAYLGLEAIVPSDKNSEYGFKIKEASK